MRPGELRRAVPGASERVLLQQLGELVTDGVLQREVLEDAVLHVTYDFTAYGRTLAPVMEALCAWGARHTQVSLSQP